jgi:threonine dehydrogenase-like Zn-dependent dehydrogenase
VKAFVITEAGKTDIVEIEKPKPGAGDVLLRVHIVGFCGSDLNTFRGRNPMVTYPRISGHEIAATIEEVGTDVPDSLKPGMTATVAPYTSCGECASCRRGRPNACQSNQTMGVQRDGAMTEYVVAPWQKVYASEKLSLRELALVEPLTIGFHAVNRGDVAEGDVCAVFGCGGIGLGAIAAASYRGAQVIAIDVDDAKLALGRKAGESLHDRLQELSGGRGPDVMIEAVGLPATYRAAVEEVAFTGRVVCIGYAKKPVEFETKLFVQKELDIRGSRNALGEFADVIEMLEAGRFPVDDVISKVVPLDEAGEALRVWDADPAAFTKILVSLD